MSCAFDETKIYRLDLVTFFMIVDSVFHEKSIFREKGDFNEFLKNTRPNVSLHCDRTKQDEKTSEPILERG